MYWFCIFKTILKDIIPILQFFLLQVNLNLILLTYKPSYHSSGGRLCFAAGVAVTFNRALYYLADTKRAVIMDRFNKSEPFIM